MMLSEHTRHVVQLAHAVWSTVEDVAVLGQRQHMAAEL